MKKQLNYEAQILIGCEESGTIQQAFADAGFYNAYSCDLLPTRGNPDRHYKRDIVEIIETTNRIWDLIILHPDCTAMSLSGNAHYGVGMDRYQERLDAIAWTFRLWELAKSKSKRTALENPTSVIFQHLDAPVVWVNPWEHGHDDSKKTGFAVKELPRILPTDMREQRDQTILYMSPGPNRKRNRSKTYDGIASALVEQWGWYL